MKRIALAAGLTLAAAVPASAIASPVTPQHLSQYRVAYHAVVRHFGFSAAGCQLGRTCHGAVSDEKIVASLGVLDRLLSPAPVVSAAPPSQPLRSNYSPAVTVQPYAAPAAPAPTYSSGGGSGGLPSCTWVPESGGNWNAVNPSSGAYGRYQIMPGTSQAYGCDLSTQAGQTNCAQEIYRRQGPSAWVNC